MTPDPTTTAIGDLVPPWSPGAIDPQRMKTMAAILRDPYPVHWDPTAVEAIGRGDRVINQGPLSLSYIANMLMAWQGPTSIARLRVRFVAPVYGGDEATAHGEVTDIIDVPDNPGEQRALCTVWLECDGIRTVEGTAEVRLS